MNNISNLEALERLCILVESAGIDIAPNFYQYADIAFGIANAVGEAGRVYFHRLCAVCPKYQYDNAERIFTNALKTGRGENGLGTVFHHAEQAGVNLGDLKRFSPSPYPPLYVSHERERSYPRTYNMQNGAQNSQNGTFPQNATTFPYHSTPSNDANVDENSTPGTEQEELPYDSQYDDIPSQFPDYTWPSFLQQIINCGEGDAQRDMLFCGTIAALGATLCHFTFTDYSKRNQYPNLQVFVIAPAASGKGAINWIRRLVLPFHKEKMAL
jgi:hypothetical protein